VGEGGKASGVLNEQREVGQRGDGSSSIGILVLGALTLPVVPGLVNHLYVITYMVR